MMHFTTAALAGLVSLSLAAPAPAAVTPEDVWQSWQKMSASVGQALVADQVIRSGDTLVVSGMKATMDQDGTKFDTAIDEIRFRDLGDGTVEVTMSDSYPMKMADIDTGNTLELTIAHPGMTLIAGGDAARTSYTLAAPTVDIKAVATEGGTTVLDIAAALTALTGSYDVLPNGDAMTFDSNLAAQTLGLTAKGGDGSASFDVTGTMAGLTLGIGGTYPGMAAMENVGRALNSGFASTTDLGFGASSFTARIEEEEGETTNVSAIGEAGNFGFALSNAGLRMEVGTTGANLTATAGDNRFPEVNLTYGEASFVLATPVMASPEPANFISITRIVDLTVPDEIWDNVDAAGVLPRDPLTVVLDTKGKITLAVDMMDEAANAALGETPPGEINALDITDLQVKGAGIDLAGSGSFVFDNSDLTTFDGLPLPTGKMEMVLKGGNGLLDKLVAMGLLPADQAIGARMMLALIAKPGVGEDVLNSSLEFRDKGFFANGQRIR